VSVGDVIHPKRDFFLDDRICGENYVCPCDKFMILNLSKKECTLKHTDSGLTFRTKPKYVERHFIEK